MLLNCETRGCVFVAGAHRLPPRRNPSTPAASAKRTLINAGHVLDVKTGKLSDAQTIVVVGDTIQSIAPSASVTAAAGRRRSSIWAA